MSKYSILLNILDQLRSEAISTKFSTLYNPLGGDQEHVNQARARAFIHLYLKVGFGMLSFEDRERCVTDGAYDGGIDGYFIHRESKCIYFIQSKFRTTESNFESKEIALDEILVMDIDRILNGEERDEKGNDYNGKIKGMIREIRNIEDIGRYRYQVVLLANLSPIAPARLKQLTNGYPADVFDYNACYRRLVFPVISGTFFNAADLNIYIDLSNKNAGSKISYTVTTKTSECEITVLFVPTIEIAKVLHRYKNSILKYNPRSYLELEGKKVNQAIRETVLNTSTNEFALFNNGITMLSDETYINERIGQKNKAQLTVRNPQIINGGQTAYTLSRIYEESAPEDTEKIFSGKEVLLKVITLMSSGQEVDAAGELELIDQISAATNQQTAVIPADRYSNENVFVEIQQTLFDRYGMLYERKRGEFGDGLHKGYVSIDEVLERNLFFRLYLASNGNVKRAAEKKLFVRYEHPEETIGDSRRLDNCYFAYLAYRRLVKTTKPHVLFQRNSEVYGQVYALTVKYRPESADDFNAVLDRVLPGFGAEWDEFLRISATKGTSYVKRSIEKKTGVERVVFSKNRWIRSATFEKDIAEFFGRGATDAVAVTMATEVTAAAKSDPEAGRAQKAPLSEESPELWGKFKRWFQKAQEKD